MNGKLLVYVKLNGKKKDNSTTVRKDTGYGNCFGAKVKATQTLVAFNLIL